MDKSENISLLEEKLENLREKLNHDIIKYINHRDDEDYNNLLTKSEELDDIIVKHMNTYNK